MKLRLVLSSSIASVLTASAALAAEPPASAGMIYSSSIAPAERRAFFGELHLHTNLSFDAWTYGTKVTPDEAYRFGRGETIMVAAEQAQKQEGVSGGGSVPVRRAWPLDFMAVTDHSEFMGTLNKLDDPSSWFANSSTGKKILKTPSYAMKLKSDANSNPKKLPSGMDHPERELDGAWQSVIYATEDNYLPGRFTTFVGYEWSSMPNQRNLHRNVIFNTYHTVYYAPLPFTSLESEKPEDLWRYIESVREHGIDAIAIPHNGNASDGLMYDWNKSNGKSIDEAYAQARALYEPVSEISQVKGQSETVPALSPNDEFANFAIFDTLIGRKTKSDEEGSYIRDAYGRGLVIERRVGVNPYKFGVVGGSDIHNGLSTSDENAFAGGAFGIDPQTLLPEGDAALKSLAIIKRTDPVPPYDTLKRDSAGLTGVWAEENERNSIFAALKRKETFATSGTRIRLRMFGGWDFDAQMVQNWGWESDAYARGVPMGSDLPVAPVGAGAPTLIVQAIKDPDGANLDRIQVIKVWRTGSNKYAEKVFDAVVSGGRTADPKTGRIPPVGNTVDLTTGTYENSIGAAVLTGVWRDPEFDPVRPAVYYARALEIPTPRWSTLLALKRALPMPTKVPATIQERAWSSPTWYTPRQSN